MGYRILGRITKTRTRLYLPALIALGLMALLLMANGSGIQALAPPPGGGSIITRVSLSSFGVEGNFNSFYPSVSADGRYIAFESYATNLVPGDTNGVADVFVRDLQTGATTQVSVDSAGLQGNGDSLFASISADGRYVAFHSLASNLVVGDTNGVDDVFVHDRDTGVTERVSVSSGSVEGDDNSRIPSISADGRYVAFYSEATNLVVGDTNSVLDVFVHDRDTGVTTRVSVSSTGVEGNSHSLSPSISADGRFVAFHSFAANLVAADTNAFADIFVHDRDTGVTERVSVDSAGVEGAGDSGNPRISADGGSVAFTSNASNLVAGDTNGEVDVFVHDRDTNVTTRVSVSTAGTEADSFSVDPSISADGRYVAFRSFATNLVAGDTNGFNGIFVRDRDTSVTTRVSVSTAGAQSNGDTFAHPGISANGRYVAFNNFGDNLVAGDTNGETDVFVRDRNTGLTARASLTYTGAEADNGSGQLDISGDGRYVSFVSSATNLVPIDTGFQDAFAALNPLSPAASCNGLGPTIVGTPGADLLTGTNGPDVIMGLGGNDTMCGGPGSDVMDGGFGDDWMSGGSGADTMRGGFGADTMQGNQGPDLIVGGFDNDFILGGGGNDQIAGADGDDLIFGGPGNDTELGGNGDDILFGHAGDDQLNCHDGADIARGGPGASDGAYANCELQVGVEVALP